MAGERLEELEGLEGFEKPERLEGFEKAEGEVTFVGANLRVRPPVRGQTHRSALQQLSSL
ncbi:MAG: hypothetical protein HQK86_13390 [Nitrospinae bacterium]|nr:hypothetical protein [Nitrospinota bacterium]